MKNIGPIILFSLFYILSLGYSIGAEPKPSVKIVYEISPEIESLANFTGDYSKPDISGENTEDLKLKYDKAFKGAGEKSALLKDNSDYLNRSTKSFRIREAIDTKVITRNLYAALVKGFTRQGFLVNSGDQNYTLSFMVNQVSYGEIKGECYIRGVGYQLLNAGAIIYRGVFVPPQKKVWFGRGEYTQLLTTDKVANKIIGEVSSKIIK